MKKFPALEQMLRFDDEEAYTLMDEYQKLLMRDGPISKLELESVVQQTDNAPQQMVDQFVAVFVNDDFGKQLRSEEAKRVKICYMRSFSAWMINYSSLINASDEMCQFIMEPEDIIKDSIGAKIANTWNKPNCEDEQVSKKALQKLTKCPFIEQFHINQIIKFAAKYPHFSNFLNKAYDFATFKTYGILDVSLQKSHYENIFWSDNSVKQMSNEVNLALSHAFLWISSRQNANKNGKLQDAEKDLLVTLRLIDIFDDELPTFRMLCTAMPFMKMTINVEMEKQKRLTWQAPDHCLSAEAEPVFAEQREFMMPFHQIFFEEFLADFSHEELLMQIIRETPGKLYMLEQFIGKDELYKHFDN
uniref:Ras-GEF domain-containing protein n=1 Tax=Globodera pallida TaxID=36090 RepID=A0A183BUA8_GLOPA